MVFRREQIISEVWRTSWEGTGRTLEVHVASLRSKLRMPALIETVRGVGYRLVAPAALSGPGRPACAPASSRCSSSCMAGRAARPRLPARREPGRRQQQRVVVDRIDDTARFAALAQFVTAGPTRRSRATDGAARRRPSQDGARNRYHDLYGIRAGVFYRDGRADGHAPADWRRARGPARGAEAFDEALAGPPQPRPAAGLALAAGPARRRLARHPGR